MMSLSSKWYIPEQGDLIIANFDPGAGCEIQKRHPAIVLSTKDYSTATGLTAVCPITNTKKTHFIPLSQDHQIKGYINALQIKTLDFQSPKRRIKFVEKATLEELGETAQIVQMIFDFQSLLSE